MRKIPHRIGAVPAMIFNKTTYLCGAVVLDILDTAHSSSALYLR